jgi:hypothetical protein
MNQFPPGFGGQFGPSRIFTKICGDIQKEKVKHRFNVTEDK